MSAARTVRAAPPSRSKRTIGWAAFVLVAGGVAWLLLASSSRVAPPAPHDAPPDAALADAAPGAAVRTADGGERTRTRATAGEPAPPEAVAGGTASVAGVVLVDGQPAPAGLELTLHTRDPAAPPNAPRTTTTQRGGVFAFDGLPADFCGTLALPRTHWLLPRDGAAFDLFRPGRLALAAPAVDLVVATTQLPVVRGRVVHDDDGAPVAAAFVSVRATFADGTTAAGSMATDRDGAFAVGLAPAQAGRRQAWCDASRRPGLQAVHVTCTNVPVADGPARVDVDDPAAAAQPIVVRIRRAPDVHFAVADAAGAPIAGAVVDVPDGTPTDATGRGTFRGGKAHLVGAPGHAVVAARPAGGDGSADRPLRFVLPRGNRLHIAVAGASGGAATALRVAIDSAAPVVDGGWSALHERFGGSRWRAGGAVRPSPAGAPEGGIL